MKTTTIKQLMRILRGEARVALARADPHISPMAPAEVVELERHNYRRIRYLHSSFAKGLRKARIKEESS